MKTVTLLNREIGTFYGEAPTRPAGLKNTSTLRRAQHGATVRRGRAFDAAARTDRVNRMIVMRESGETLEAIGATFGISRERVRQLLAREGCDGSGMSQGDPVAIMRLVRDPATTHVTQMATALGVHGDAVHRFLRESGRAKAVARLFRWRRQYAARARLVAQLRVFTERSGRTPFMHELGTRHGTARHPDLPNATTLVSVFGSVVAAFEAAGLERRARGHHGHAAPRRAVTHCRRGHALTPENTYRYARPDGGFIRHCKTCKTAEQKARRQAKRGGAS